MYIFVKKLIYNYHTPLRKILQIYMFEKINLSFTEKLVKWGIKEKSICSLQT